MYPEALSTKQCMDFSLGEPERIHNIFLSSYARQKNYVNFVMYPEALSTKQCMDFSLGEPERIHNIFLSSYARQKNYVDFVMYPEALSTKQCMDFSLGEPERIPSRRNVTHLIFNDNDILTGSFLTRR